MSFSYLIPESRMPESDDEYFEELAKNIFRVGFNWRVVEKRWPSIKVAFDQFSIPKVSTYDREDLARLFADSSVIRHRKKIEAIVANAKLFAALVKEHGSFGAYLASFRKDAYPVRRDRVALTFRHLGKTGAFCFLYCVNEAVPSWDERFMETE